MTSRALWLPRSGHLDEEYEDAFRLPADEAVPLRAAVADGAAGSVFARTWAMLLAEGFVTQGSAEPSAFAGHLRRWQGVWSALVASRKESMPWYAAEREEEGALAAFLGIALHKDRTWQALAVGDCCLFHLRAGDVLLAWPVDAPERFDGRPDLLPSLPDRPAPAPLVHAGAWRPGDAFLLASAVLAAWLMRTGPAAALAWTTESFRTGVAEARADGSMRNNDVTLVELRV